MLHHFIDKYFLQFVAYINCLSQHIHICLQSLTLISIMSYKKLIQSAAVHDGILFYYCFVENVEIADKEI